MARAQKASKSKSKPRSSTGRNGHPKSASARTTSKSTAKKKSTRSSKSRSTSKRSTTSASKKNAAKKTSAKKSSAKKKALKKTAGKKKARATRSAGTSAQSKEIAAKKSSGGKTSKTATRSGNRGKSSAPSKEELVWAYRQMLRARLNDLKTIVLYKQNKCHFQIGVAGHEAVQVAAGAVFRPGTDWFYPYYRDMALCAALGMSDSDFMLMAMNKQDDPNSHGRQMPMHYGHVDLRIINQSSPTGTQFLQATGCALAVKKQEQDEVVYVSSGEGSCAQGDFHEALNWSSREKLPVIFLIQNNNFAISVPVADQISGGSVYEMAAGYANLARYKVDGTNYIDSLSAFKEAHARARRGEGPALIEADVPRLQSHSISDNHLKYRTAADVAADQQRCPLQLMSEFLLSKKIVKKADLEIIENTLKAEIDQAAEWAEAQPDPDPAEALMHTFHDPHPENAFEESTPTGNDVYLVDALNHALDEELERNPGTYIFGQDVAGGKGGVFTVTSGLTAKYGKERVFNSQLAESSIAGVAIGMATVGLKPIAEIQFGDYVWTAMMQIRNELAMLRYRSGNDFSCPAVLRIAVGGYIHGSCYHSQCIEATFAHFPGLYVVFPSNASDAKGLLKAAIRSDDPVLFLEHKGLYRQVYAKGPEGGVDDLIPIGRGKIVRGGDDLTIVTWGALVQKSILAAKELAREGFSVEVIDLRTIAPLDSQLIFDSVRKTNRVLIAHEDTQFMGFGAEVAAQIAEECFEHLDAPIRRIGMKYAAAVPHAAGLESVVLPQNNDVVVAARNLIAF